MERIVYRKTLDVHKSGIQFMLQGFETADNLSRVIEINLMASGDAIDFPLERLAAMMYVKTPGANEPSINKCTIKDNKVIYNVLPIDTEGITTMQLKLIETSVEGATSVLASPRFAVEVSKSEIEDESAEQSVTFTALEDAMAKAKTVYDERFLRMELSSDCMFRAFYADGTVYETDILKNLFHTGSSVLSESFARGSTGVRAGEDTDNSMYYSNVSKSEALNAKSIMEGSKEILEEIKLHGVYTVFKVDFETGNMEYFSPSFKFSINTETGELIANGQTYSLEDEIGRIIVEWLEANGITLSNLQKISETHTQEITELKEIANEHSKEIKTLESRVTPIELGGTGATTPEEALIKLGITDYQKPWNVDENIGNININTASMSVSITASELEKYNEPVTGTMSIPRINSGNIYLYITEWDTVGDSTKLKVDNITIFINDIEVARNTDSTLIAGLTIPLSVTKNDILKIALTGHATRTSASGTIRLRGIHLLANIDTPYKYISFKTNAIYSHDPDYTKVLDTLLGVTE